MRIVLIGNYLPDKQESMQRFAHMLKKGFQQAGFASEVWVPGAFFGRGVSSTTAGIGKWLGYLDKWVVFPLLLRWRRFRTNTSQVETCFHICDHSNAPYLNHLPSHRTSLTCHDVLAIRGGLGHADACVTTSRLGKILQAWILSSLSKSKKIAAVSQLTLNQLQALAPFANADKKDWRVIHNAFNADFYPMQAEQAQAQLNRIGFNSATPFLLHVGSGLARKNRLLLLDMAVLAGERWQGNICFAGEAIDSVLLRHADLLGLRARVISVVKPDHATLVALYSTCTAFVFPSYSEGFGWPVIEAQACGASVIASDVAPMPEVSGGAALHADPANAQQFADAFMSLESSVVRNALIQQGFANCQRFERQRMIAAYLDLLTLSHS